MLTDHHDSQYDKVARMTLKVVAILSSSEASVPLSSSDPSPISPTHRGGKTAKETSNPLLAKKGNAGKAAIAQQKDQQPKLNQYFQKFMVELLKMFELDATLLENKGSFVIR